MKTKILLRKLGPPILVLASLVLGTSQSQIQSAPPPGPVPPVQQAWVARYNGPGNLDDGGHAIAGDSSGNVYVTGGSHGQGTDLDYATIKYTSAGQEAWVARYNGPGNGDDRAAAIAVDSSGNVYVTGFSVGSSGLVEYATIKYNSAGQKVWVARYNNGPGNGEDHAAAIAVDSSGNVYVTGFSGGTGYDYATVKYNSAGQKVWVARYNGPGNGNDEAQGIAVDSSGNVYVTGFSASPSGFFDYATIKYNSMGTQQWVARYNNDPVNGDSIAYAMAIDSSGNVYVTGYSVGSDPRRFADYATVKYDSLHGTQQWVARYNNDPVNGNSIAYAMAIDGSGNVYVTGYSDGDRQTSADYATVKYGSLLGTQQWVARYNGSGSGYDRAEAIAIDRSGNVYVTGFSVGRGSYFDYATVKYDSAGVRQWVARYNGPGRSGDDEAQGIVVDGSGNVYVTGESQGSGTGYDYATIKYVQNPP